MNPDFLTGMALTLAAVVIPGIAALIGAYRARRKTPACQDHLRPVAHSKLMS